MTRAGEAATSAGTDALKSAVSDFWQQGNGARLEAEAGQRHRGALPALAAGSSPVDAVR